MVWVGIRLLKFLHRKKPSGDEPGGFVCLGSGSAYTFLPNFRRTAPNNPRRLLPKRITVLGSGVAVTETPARPASLSPRLLEVEKLRSSVELFAVNVSV
jgi:hypothetical protein